MDFVNATLNSCASTARDVSGQNKPSMILKTQDLTTARNNSILHSTNQITSVKFQVGFALLHTTSDYGLFSIQRNKSCLQNKSYQSTFIFADHNTTEHNQRMSMPANGQIIVVCSLVTIMRSDNHNIIHWLAQLAKSTTNKYSLKWHEMNLCLPMVR